MSMCGAEAAEATSSQSWGYVGCFRSSYGGIFENGTVDGREGGGIELELAQLFLKDAFAKIVNPKGQCQQGERVVKLLKIIPSVALLLVECARCPGVANHVGNILH